MGVGHLGRKRTTQTKYLCLTYAFGRKIEKKMYSKKRKSKVSTVVQMSYGYENPNSNKLSQIKCNSMSF